MGQETASLLTFQLQDRSIWVASMYLHMVSNQRFPSGSDDVEWKKVTQFLSERAQQILGKWPVCIIFPEVAEIRDGTFSGIRVFAGCCSIASPGNGVERLNLIWHQEAVQITFHQGLDKILTKISWSELAELTDS